MKDSSSKNRAVLDAYSVFTYNIMFACLDSWLWQAGFSVSSFRCGLFSAPPTVPQQAWRRCCNNNIEGTDCSWENTWTDDHSGQQQDKDYEHEDIVSLYRHIHKTDERLPICSWHPVDFNMVLLNLIFTATLAFQRPRSSPSLARLKPSDFKCVAVLLVKVRTNLFVLVIIN